MITLFTAIGIWCGSPNGHVTTRQVNTCRDNLIECVGVAWTDSQKIRDCFKKERAAK